MKLKKLLATVLTMAMVATVLPVTAFAAENEAKVGTTEFPTLEEAAAAAQSGNTITLLTDAELTEALTLPAGITLNGNGKQINGTIYAGGDLTFEGHTKVTTFSASYYDRTITIGEGACLEVTGTGRVTLGYGNTFNITGSISNAKTADKESVQPSLIVPGGFSITGGNDAAFNVTNAYVQIGSTTSKNSGANGKFDINFTNSIIEFTSQFTLSEPTSGMNPTFNVNIKDSVMTTGTKFINAVPNGNITIDNSTVTLSTYFRNSGTTKLINGSELAGSTIQFGENGGNDGTITVDNSTLTINASSEGHALDGKGTGKLIAKNGATVDVDFVVESAITVDTSSELIATKVTDVTDKGDSTVTVMIDANSKVEDIEKCLENVGGLDLTDVKLDGVTGAELEKDSNGDLVLKVLVAKIGDTPYYSLQDALKAISSGCVVEILNDVTITEDWDNRNTGAKITVPVTINGNNHTIKFTGKISDGFNYLSAFRFEEAAEVNDLTVDMSEAEAVFQNRFSAISTKAGDLTVDNCTFIGSLTYTNGRAIIFGEGAGDALPNVDVKITDSKFINWGYGVTDNMNGQDANSVSITENEFENANVNVSAAESVVFTDNELDDSDVTITSYSENSDLKVTVAENKTDKNSELRVNNATVEGTPEGVKGAKIGEKYYSSLTEAVKNVQDGETIQLLAGTFEEGTIKLPATLKNVTFKGAEGAVLKDMTIMAYDGSSFSYEGLTFDGITFDNSRISITGWRSGDETVNNLTVTNCVFKNLNDDTNSAPVHINKDAAEAVNGFTFTNNVIDGATGGSKSGVYAQVTGEVTFTDNVINNVAFRPYVIQITTDDGIADTFKVEGNTFSGSAAGRAQALTNNAEGTDNVTLTVKENIFQDITSAQQICYWNFNEETTTADISENYYDIDIMENPDRIYYNKPAESVDDLVEMGVFPIYTELNEDGTIDESSLYDPTAPVVPPASIGGSTSKSYKADVNTDDIENGSIRLNKTKAKPGTEVTITVTPDKGYVLDELKVLNSRGTEIDVTDNGDGTFTFKMPKGGVDIEASFVEGEAAPVVPADKEETLVLTIGQVFYQLNGTYEVNDVAPIIKADRTFLPIRLIAEFLGATVTWNEAEQAVTIVNNDTEIVIYIGQAFALVNGEPVQLDAPAFIQNDRTYLPVRFIAENLGAEVLWDGVNQTVTVIG